MIDVYQNTWASLVVWIKDQLKQMRALSPQHPMEYIDWEAHATNPELPNTDLVGPLALAVSEYEDGLYAVNVSFGVSTYVKDRSLYRQRLYTNFLFNQLQSGAQITYYDHAEAVERSVIQMRPGTTVAPMDDITNRPFQYIQCSGLLVPAGRDA